MKHDYILNRSLPTRLLLSLLFIAGFSSFVLARSYTVDPHLVWLNATHTYGYIVISGNGGNTETLDVNIIDKNDNVVYALYDSSSRRYGTLGSHILLSPDSTGNSMASIGCSYKTISSKQLTTYIIISNAGKTEVDTIVVQTMDSTAAHDRNSITVDGDSYHYFSTSVNGTDTRQFSFQVRNKYTETVDVGITSSDNALTSPFSYETASLGIEPIGQNPNGETFTVTYKPTHPGEIDSVDFTFTPSAPSDAIPAVLHLVVTNSTPPQVKLTVITPYFGVLEQGVKTCQTMALYNPYGTPITVSALTIGGPDAADYAFDPVPTLPLTVKANSYVTLTLCCTAPNRFNTSLESYVAATYSNGVDTNLSAVSKIYTTLGGCVFVGLQHDTIYMGTVIGGGWIEMNARITNHSGVTISVDSARDLYTNGSENVFTIANTFPFTLAPDETKQLDMLFTPSTVGNYGTRFALYLSSAADTSCHEAGMEVDGYFQPDDSSRIPIFPSETETLNILSTSSRTTKRFVLTNNLSTSVTVRSVSVKDGTHFSVTSPTASDLPVTIAAYSTMNVDLTFDAGSSGKYSDSLVIVTDHAATTQTFVLHGTLNAASVSSPTALLSPTLAISPNPTENDIHIELVGASAGRFEIYNELGVLLLSQPNTNAWHLTASEHALSAGMYVVRASGSGSNGNPFVVSKRFVITKH